MDICACVVHDGEYHRKKLENDQLQSKKKGGRIQKESDGKKKKESARKFQIQGHGEDNQL